jgi:hypothetical protein
VCLRQEALDLQTVLLVPVACFVDSSCLLHLELQEFLDAILHDLPALFHPTSERLQRLFQLCVHLLGDALVSLAHGLDFGADNITGHSERAGFRGSEGFARELQELLGVIFLDGGACGVKGFQFVVGDLRKVHAVQQGPDAGVIFAPKVVGDWELSVVSRAACMSRACVHESVTVGTSDVDEPGMMPAVYKLERGAQGGSEQCLYRDSECRKECWSSDIWGNNGTAGWCMDGEGTQAPNPRAELCLWAAFPRATRGKER